MPDSATAGGFLLVFAIVLPVVGALLSLVLGGRHAERVTLILVPVGLAVAVAIAASIWRTHGMLQYFVGGWDPPLGVAFRADGLSAVMLVTAALLICGIGLFARAQFPSPRGAEKRAPSVFWTLLLTNWGALNAVFIGGDLFNLYVALELLTFAAVPLVSLDGRPETLAAALRYLLFALFGSILYLLGAVLLYGVYGTLDIVLLASRIRAERAAAQVLGILGAAAILFGSAVALRQARLKLLIAYSTVAQIGYLFLMFPLAIRPETGHPWSATAWTGGVLQAISHAFAKAAMFMAAGLIAEAFGHDRIERLAGAGRALPITVFAFGLGGLSLMGLPPSGGFIAKAMLLTAAVSEGQWWWAVVVLAGGLLAGGYVFVVLARALADASEPVTLRSTISPGRQAVVVALALCAVLLGFVPLRSLELLQIGRPT